jgi:glycerate kinase
LVEHFHGKEGVTSSSLVPGFAEVVMTLPATHGKPAAGPRIVVAPNAFRDGPSQQAVAKAMAAGVAKVHPEAHVESLPLADGGDGTFDVLAGIFRAHVEHRGVAGPTGKQVVARIGVGGGFGFCEMADAVGPGLIPAAERDPFHASTYGVGEMIAALLDRGVRRLFVGAGGSATLDAGAGALAALGARFEDARGRQLEPTPAGLESVETVDLSGLDPRLGAVELVVLADVVIPVRDSARLFGAQKGLRSETAGRVGAVLERLDRIAQRHGQPMIDLLWRGAGGGLPAGLSVFAGARVVPGALYVAARSGLARALRGADLLLTGEGRLDLTSFAGKVTVTAASAASHRGVPTLLLAGAIADGVPSLPPGARASALGTTPASEPPAVLARITEVTDQLLRQGW